MPNAVSADTSNNSLDKENLI